MPFFQRNRRQEIEALQLLHFYSDAHIYLSSKYYRLNNRFIKWFLKILKGCWDWQLNQVRDYQQLVLDYPFWKFRQQYLTSLENFVRSDVTTEDLVEELVYMIIEQNIEGRELAKDYSLQENLDLDFKSLGFSKILIDLLPLLEGYDPDPEESFFTEQEFREIIQSSLEELKKY